MRNFSSSHNYLSKHFGLLFIQLKCSAVMCLMVEYEFESSLHNPLYCSGVDGVLGCFGTVHSIHNKTWKDLKFSKSESSIVLCTVHCAKASKYIVHATAVRGIVYTTVELIFDHQTHHFNAFQLNKEQTKMLWNLIMTAANISHLCTSIFHVIAWSQGCCCSKWRDNGHGEKRLLVSFVDGYCSGYYCLRETVAWPAQKIGMDDIRFNMDEIVNVTKWCGFYYFRENKMDYIVNSDKMI